MRKFGILLLLILSMVSCSSDNDDNKPAYIGKWELSSMDRNKNPAANSAPIMEWQETYTFNSKGNFSKTRIKDGKTSTVSGTYTVTKNADRTELSLHYSAQNEIIGTCSSDLTEHLYIVDTFEVLYNSWGTCDGPSMEYNKIK